MWSIIQGLLSQVVGPAISYISNNTPQILNAGKSFLKKYWLTLAIVLASLGAGFYLYTQINNAKNNAAYWQNEAAKARGLYQISESLYETQVVKLATIGIANTVLNARLKATDRQLVQVQSLNLSYKATIDSLYNTDPVVITVHDTTNKSIDTTDRTFNIGFNNEFLMNGYFQTHSPFGLFVKDISFNAKLDIVISKDNKEAYYWTIDTHSKFLKPSNVQIQITDTPVKWEYFVSGSLIFDDTKTHGIGVMGGIKRGDWAGFAGINAIMNIGTLYQIGLIKYWSF